MALITPQIHIFFKDGKQTQYRHFNTYRKLKQNIKDVMDEFKHEDAEFVVYRSRRGQWGEWFEYWGLNYKRKPVITKQGWN